jgi:hypothetical protein
MMGEMESLRKELKENNEGEVISRYVRLIPPQVAGKN